MARRPSRLAAQSAMEYLMTYGWAILIIAVVLAALFELGVFNGSNLAPQACIAQAGFVCRNPVYTSNGIALTLGQTTGRDYYDVWVFISSQGEALNSSGIPVNFSTANAIGVGFGPNNALSPGQTFLVNFPHVDFPHGAIPSNPPIGTPFAGYVWLGYCLSPCSGPTAYSKVATITIKSTAGFAGPTTTSITVTTTTTTTTTTSIATTTIHYVNITLDSTGGSASAGFQQMLQFNPSSYSNYEASDLGNLRFYQGGPTPSNELYSWCESGCTSGSTSAIFWIKTNGLASGTTTNAITMYFEYPYTTAYSGPSGHAGEAPQISPTYAQYDNGASVFPAFYVNFAGNALPSSLIGGCNSFTVNNGLSIATSTSSGPCGMTSSTATFNPGSVFDALFQTSALNTADPIWMLGFGDISGSNTRGTVAFYSPANGCMSGHLCSGESNVAYGCLGPAMTTASTYSVLTTAVLSSTTSYQYVNYGSQSMTTCSESFPEYVNLDWYLPGGTFPAPLNFQWVRIRMLPPNGVMPSVVSFGAVQ